MPLPSKMRPIVRPVTPRRVRSLRAALLALPLAALAAAAPLVAQNVTILRSPDANRRVVISDDRPMIGVTTASESGRADTLGLRVESVQKGSPAEKAGLKEGDRLQSANSVSLRADRADAGEDDYAGVLNRRLQREVQRTKEGESLELRVLSGTQVRTVRVTPVKGSILNPVEERGMIWRTNEGDRALLGLTIASTGTARDTIGVFVQAVVPDGPAEKAGIIEGDRIAAINGVSLRVAPADREDPEVGAARAERLSREVAKLKAGEQAELTVVTAGRTRTVKVTAVKASDLPGGAMSTFFFRSPPSEPPAPPVAPEPPAAPEPMRLRLRTLPESGMQEQQLRHTMEELLQRAQPRLHRRVIHTTI